MKLNIVHCVYSFNVGGLETMLVDIMNEQIKKDNVSLIIINDSFDKMLINHIDFRVKIYYIHRKPKSRSLWPIIKLNYLLIFIGARIIHLHNYTLSRIILPIRGRKIYYTVHDLNIPMIYAGRIDCLFAISKSVEEDILSKGNFSVRVVPNGIAVNKIEERKDICSFLGRKMRIVQVARLDKNKKGQDILIEAISILKRKGISDVIVDFIGAGPSENVLRLQSISLDVEKQINFLGLRSREYIYSHLKDYDLMCHPARYEGFGLCVAEGLAAKLPVLVSNTDGPFEIIQYGKYGFSFENGNPEDCALQIEYIYRHYSDLYEMTSTFRQYISQNYSVKQMVDLYRKNYISFIK